MARVSKRLLIALKLHELPAYRIAQKAGISPNTLSKLMNGIEAAKPNDPRILAIGQILGLRAEDCFEPTE